MGGGNFLIKKSAVYEVSQLFASSAGFTRILGALLQTVVDELWRRFGRFKLGAYLLKAGIKAYTDIAVTGGVQSDSATPPRWERRAGRPRIWHNVHGSASEIRSTPCPDALHRIALESFFDCRTANDAAIISSRFFRTRLR